MAGKNHSEKTTKELILDAAFSFCNEPRFKSFSMNDLAAKVGISKPAIYRHYKDKDAVIAAMYERFFASLADCLRTVEAQTKADGAKIVSEKAFADLVSFFTEHPYYINYMLANMCTEDNFERRIADELAKQGIAGLAGGYEFFNGKKAIDAESLPQYVRGIYCGVTIFIFIKLREKWISKGGKAESVEAFAKNLVHVILSGFKHTVPRDHILFPAEISDERFAELDALCTIGADMLPPEDRIFTALAQVIAKYKIVGVTVDKIAAELNMAKSSLYEYFDNKNQMIKTLIVRELTIIDMAAKENALEARTFSEYIYILMRTELSYFVLRPSIIPVCGWLLQTTTDDPFKDEFDSSNPWIEKLPDPIVPFTFGMEVRPKHFMSWISSLPVALVVQWANRSLNQDVLVDVLKMIFNYMEYGIEQPSGENPKATR